MKGKWMSLVVIMIFMLMSFGLPKNMEKKVDKEVKDVFKIESCVYQAVNVPEEIGNKLPSDLTSDNFFRIISGEKYLGYVYIDKAPSKTAEFDYLVIFDDELKIARAKVLVYREEYGGEIGSKRWLSQFMGKTAKDSLDDVAAISGATISVRSMTKAIKNILKSVEVLQSHKII